MTKSIDKVGTIMVGAVDLLARRAPEESCCSEKEGKKAFSITTISNRDAQLPLQRNYKQE